MTAGKLLKQAEKADLKSKEQSLTEIGVHLPGAHKKRRQKGHYTIYTCNLSVTLLWGQAGRQFRFFQIRWTYKTYYEEDLVRSDTATVQTNLLLILQYHPHS